LLAAHSSIRHFRYLLEGSQFELWIDHKPLIATLNRLSPLWTPPQLTYITEFTSNIRHVPGKDNVVADALSCPTPSAVAAEAVSDFEGINCSAQAAPNMDLQEMAAQHLTCLDTQHLRESPMLHIMYQPVRDQQLLSNISTGFFRPLVLSGLRKVIFESLHGLAHPGIRPS